MKLPSFLAALSLLTSLVSAAEPPAGPLHAWYRDDGVKADGPNVTAWQSAATNGAAQNLTRVVGRPQAVPLAAVLAAPEKFRGRRVGIVLTGGNVDLDKLPWQ